MEEEQIPPSLEEVTLESLSKKRGSVKSRVTVFKKYLQGLDKANINEQIIIAVQARLAKIKPLYDTFHDLQTARLEMLENVNVAAEELICEEFENLYFETISFAEDIIQTYYQPPHQSFHAPSPGNVAVPPAPPVTHRNSSDAFNLFDLNSVSLPKIKLPIFSGNVNMWLEFRDTFSSLIHTNNALPPIAKFHYLKSSLDGEAALAIKGIDVSANAYTQAWDLLKERYDNDNFLIHNHIRHIYSLAQITRESSSALKQIADSISTHLEALRILGLPVDSWDVPLIYFIHSKLDSESAREWDNVSKVSKTLPTLKQFMKFIRDRANLLDLAESRIAERYQRAPKQQLPPKTSQNFEKKIIGRPTFKMSCNICGGEHFTSRCSKLQNVPVSKRIDEVKRRSLCYNCLRSGHSADSCRSSNCQRCGSKHHTILHVDQSVNLSTNSNIREDTANLASANSNATTTLTSRGIDNVLLPTAVIQIQNSAGQWVNARALLDSASTSNFISNILVKKLMLKTFKHPVPIDGISGESATANYQCNIFIRSQYSSFHANVPCLILNKITTRLPSTKIDRHKIHIPKQLQLADPLFDTPGDVDVLIGAGYFWNLISNSKITKGLKQPVLQETRLGWIVTGNLGEKSNQVHTHVTTTDTNKILAKFWELEEVKTNAVLPLTKDQQICESHFLNTYQRDISGRFIVEIPLKRKLSELGQSYDIAYNRFLSLERRLYRPGNEDLRSQYNAFMQEYLALGHMSLAEKPSGAHYYLPHHCVINSKSKSTKLRVVFDGSSKTTSGLSLNDMQHVGPVLQQDLFSILLRFRKHRYVIQADIEKMYRQVMIKNSQRDLQRIIWRFAKSEPVAEYTLNTVTYGTASASYLAIKCLHVIANETGDEKIKSVISSDFYVDDLLTGADSITELIIITRKIISALQSAGMRLHKFNSNDTSILKSLNCLNLENSLHAFDQEIHSRGKVLGLLWSPAKDVFTYDHLDLHLPRVTKRVILSLVASIFDPLGLLAPVIIRAKLLLRKLWLAKQDWDAPVDINIRNEFINLFQNFAAISQLKISRFLGNINDKSAAIHGFCDASEAAYGACLYLVVNSQNSIKSQLITAKSKVAPIKTQTIPRLELCAALLLSRLLTKTYAALQINNIQINLWSDSTIVLSWLKLEPSSLNTFVAHRISEIQLTTQNATWRHIATENNPADYLSRGIHPSQLGSSRLWWHGPENTFKNLENLEINRNIVSLTDLPEVRANRIQATIVNISEKSSWFTIKNYSSFDKTRRIMAYILRFISNCQSQNKTRSFLSTEELMRAEKEIIKIAQGESYSEEIRKIKLKGELSVNSKLSPLSPFIDENGIVRVGGRIKYSRISNENKHPMIISGSHHIAELILRHYHILLLHAGPLNLLNHTRQRFWITNGRNLARKIVHKCIICFRASPRFHVPFMGNLPESRITPNFPFLNTGIDYGGPFLLKTSNTRGNKQYKAYLALFVCMVTKAVHLELVTSLSSDAFLATLRRFIARRGQPLNIYSDNGTNFIGANRELKEVYQFLRAASHEVGEALSEKGVNWHFSPPRGSNFGGLWEASIKSVKTHLSRVIGERVLTYEDFSTLLTQIEAVVNSRPLSPLSSDPNDNNPLTPAHFLIGRPLTAVVEHELTDISDSRLNAFQRIQSMYQHFWKRWAREYIHTLQQRPKWKTRGTARQVEKGDLVLIAEDNQLPLRWKTGRVSELHAGRDGIVRVVTIATPEDREMKRPVSKICLLPIEEHQGPSDSNQEDTIDTET